MTMLLSVVGWSISTTALIQEVWSRIILDLQV